MPRISNNDLGKNDKRVNNSDTEMFTRKTEREGQRSIESFSNHVPFLIMVNSKELIQFLETDKQKYFPKEDVLIVGNETQLSNWPAVSSVQTLEDLELVKVQLCTRPLILLVQCGKHVPVGQRLNNRGRILGPSDVEWWLMPSSTPWNESYPPVSTTAQSPQSEQFLQVQFAVVVDTSHPVVQRQLKDGFRTATALLNKKKAFCLEFDFNPVILDWWLNQGPQHWLRLNCMDTAYCTGARVSVTNTNEPCHVLDFGVWWTLCLPCYCLLAVPYKVWRSLICQICDHQFKIRGNVQVIPNIEDLQMYKPKHQRICYV